jgi:hypothetical protein
MADFAARLGLAGFTLALDQAVLGMGGEPTIGEESIDAGLVIVPRGRQVTEHIGQVRQHVDVIQRYRCRNYILAGSFRLRLLLMSRLGKEHGNGARRGFRADSVLARVNRATT